MDEMNLSKTALLNDQSNARESRNSVLSSEVWSEFKMFIGLMLHYDKRIENYLRKDDPQKYSRIYS
jgi:hypothetical protein